MHAEECANHDWGDDTASAVGVGGLTRSYKINQKFRPAFASRAVLFLEEFFDAFNVGRDVHTYGVVFDFGDANFPAIFEPAELFELLDAFEHTLGERGIFEESVALENVEAEMFQVADLDFAGCVANPRDGCARKVEAIVVEIEDGFHDVGIHDVRGSFDGSGDGGDCRGRLFEKRVYGGVHGSGIEERFVTLYVDEDVAFFMGGDFSDAFSAGAMVGARHASFAAETLDGFYDAFIVGGDNDAMGARGEFGAFVDALNHRLACQRNEGLAR